jgi:hypothetical protein
MSDAGDPEVYLAGAAAILSEYPDEVLDKICDPRTGTKVLKAYPTLHDIRAACQELYAPIEREEERSRAHESHVSGLLPPRKRTPEEQAHIDMQVERARVRLGLVRGRPPSGRISRGAP